MNKILFDASSTSTTSPSFYVAPGTCVLINAWNMGVGEVAEVWRLLTRPGSIPGGDEGKCSPALAISSGQILRAEPYVPCNTPVQVGETATQNITSIVLSQPGFYNLHLTPAALGTAVVEAVFLEGEEACAQAAATCCCTPIQNWAGTSASPCLSITPGGVNGNEPVFDLDPCCVLQQIVTPGAPTLADSIIFLQGGACLRATLQDVVDLVFVCGTLGAFPLGVVAPLDSFVTVDSGAGCKRLDAATTVTALETPWAGVSANAFLTITPGGVNGHAPTFDYDLCGEIQSFPSCACEPTPGDLVPIIQGGVCVLATWPVVDLCDQMALLTVGTLIAGDNVPVIEAGGTCKLVPATDFAGGGAAFPLLGPDGTCASPTYSFTSSTDSGMFYTGTAVRISDDNCADFIDVGASINVTSTLSNITLSATSGTLTGLGATVVLTSGTGVAITASSGNVVNTASASFVVVTNATNRLAIDFGGAWQLAGDPGAAAEVLTSAGPGVPPVWAPVSATVTFPLHAPTAVTPQYSFVAQTDMGMAMDGAQLHFGSLDTVSPAWAFSSRLSIDTGATGDMFLYGSRGDGSRGANIDIKGGDALNPGVQVEGGTATIRGGNSSQSNGGAVTVLGGNSTGTGTGGDATLRAGDAVTGTAGSVLITAGLSAGGASGGNIRMRTNHENFGAPAAITMDHHGSVQYGDPFVFASQANAAGRSFWYGVAGDAVFTTGQEIRVWAGPGRGAGAGGAGGNLDLAGGLATGANNNGGQLVLKGGNQTGAGIKGYVQLERVTTAPVAAPNVVAGYAPIILVDDGTLRLFGWRQSDNSWRSVTLT